MTTLLKRGATFVTEQRLVVETCCSCQMQFAMPSELKQRLLDGRTNGKSKTFYCPAGHPQWYVGESEADALRRERDRLKQDNAYEAERRKRAQDEAEHQRARANGYKGALAKTKKRVGNGTCPCCQRSFENLRRHMATKHPEFATTVEEFPPCE